MNNKLTERITIQEYKTIQNENGFDEEIWKEYYTCWSGFRQITGKEYISAKATNSENITTFTVRYCNKLKELLKPGATKVFRVKFNEEFYDIQYASDYNNSHQYIDLKCKVTS
ncbi:phage head closure protein [Eubacterium multiforme]|uniref:SPP1 family predicted phage head-tail adaptor n=1 Tax=Eubacterium multiforme TaxID=83339 RepID=A0ABT9USC3_9FIRM|nr:phage head closure protein [Eubacterium multiforme]MDQ0149217.1 SPP1 family predicted phage head-tail adaptor [Eubacterium multiforme]